MVEEGGYSEPDRGDLEAITLKEEGNNYLRAGEPENALDCYQRSLALLGGKEASGREAATVLGNISAAHASLHNPRASLQAARAAGVADPSYSKALFREAKALLALREPSDAVRAALHLLFLAGSSVEADVQKILAAAEPRVPRALVPLAPASAPASSLEVTMDLLQLVARCCDGEDLTRLGQTGRRFFQQLDLSVEVLKRATLACPAHSKAWIRTDDVLGSPGWAYALHQAHRRNGVHDCVAVCKRSGGVSLVPAGGGAERPLPKADHCLDWTLCWGPHAEYLAFTAVNESQNTALVVIPTRGHRPPLVIPLIPFLTPYYLCPSPCGTRLAVLGSVKRQQVLLIADLSPLLLSCPKATARLSCLGTAAPLYFDWAPHAPELLAVCHEKKLVKLETKVSDQAPTLKEPPEAILTDLESLEGTEIRGRISFRAPQWLPDPSGRGHGRWLVPRDNPSSPRVSLALVDPETNEAEILCENLPPEAHFTATPSWVAWCGLHDEHGHGGVFARRIHPKLGPPFTAFTHPNRVEGMTWGGSRLALLVHAPNCLVWTVWDAELAETRSSGCLTVAPVGFVPNRVFSGRVLPFFDQFERRLRFWNPGNDALVYADAESEVWVQSFPRESSLLQRSTPHPLSSLFGFEELRVAPPRVRIAEGSFACWSPV